MAGQTFPALGAPTLAGGARVIASPFQFVGDADTWLRVTSVCSVSGVVLAVQGRRLDDSGLLKPITETHAPNSDRTVKTTELLLGPGALLNLTVFASSGSPLVGQCYVMIQLLRSHGATAIVLGTLLAGNVTAVQALGFPGSPVVSSLEVLPAVRSIVGTMPAVGVDVSETVPTGARWELLSFMVPLTTVGVGANRQVVLGDRRGGVGVGFYPNAFTIAPGTTGFNFWAPNLPSITNAVFGYLCSAVAQPMVLMAGDQLVTVTANFNPADGYGTPRYVVKEWLEAA